MIRLLENDTFGPEHQTSIHEYAAHALLNISTYHASCMLSTIPRKICKTCLAFDSHPFTPFVLLLVFRCTQVQKNNFKLPSANKDWTHCCRIVVYWTVMTLLTNLVPVYCWTHKIDCIKSVHVVLPICPKITKTAIKFTKQN